MERVQGGSGNESSDLPMAAAMQRPLICDRVCNRPPLKSISAFSLSRHSLMAALLRHSLPLCSRFSTFCNRLARVCFGYFREHLPFWSSEIREQLRIDRYRPLKSTDEYSDFLPLVVSVKSLKSSGGNKTHLHMN